MPAEKFQGPAEGFFQNGRPHDAGKIVSAPEEENPGQNGKIVRGIEAGPGETEDHHGNAPIQKVGQRAETDGFKTKTTGGDVAGEEEEDEAADKPCGRRDTGEQRRKQGGQKYRDAVKAEHAHDDDGIRHDKGGDGSNQKAAAGKKQPSAQLSAEAGPAYAPAIAGQEEEGPTDTLLPEVPGKPLIAGDPAVIEIDQIIGSVVGDHTEQRNAAQTVQKGKAFWRVHRSPPFVPGSDRLCREGRKARNRNANRQNRLTRIPRVSPAGR